MEAVSPESPQVFGDLSPSGSQVARLTSPVESGGDAVRIRLRRTVGGVVVVVDVVAVAAIHTHHSTPAAAAPAVADAGTEPVQIVAAMLFDIGRRVAYRACTRLHTARCKINKKICVATNFT